MVAESGVETAAGVLAAALGSRVRRDVPLAPMTTYRVGGAASVLVEVGSVDDLAAVADARRLTGAPVLVVGRGSNMLVSDRGFDGIAISLAGFAEGIGLPAGPPRPGQPCDVVVGGGAALPVVARRTAAASIAGFEWAVGVPGSVGGAVRMNAGGHGSDMAACLIDVDVFDLDADTSADGLLRPVLAAELGLRFRASDLPPSAVVVAARLRLGWGDRERSERTIADIVRWRREHQPGGQNCGSVFVNPVPGEVTSGGLIDGLGLRGLRIGTASVSDKHANFIQADEGGTAADVRAVIDEVRRRVAVETGYRLRSEVRLVGFDDVDPLSFEEQTAP